MDYNYHSAIWRVKPQTPVSVAALLRAARRDARAAEMEALVKSFE